MIASLHTSFFTFKIVNKQFREEVGHGWALPHLPLPPPPWQTWRLNSPTWLLQPLSHLTILSLTSPPFHPPHRLRFPATQYEPPPVYHNNPFMDHKRLKGYSALNSIMENKEKTRMVLIGQQSVQLGFYEGIVGHGRILCLALNRPKSKLVAAVADELRFPRSDKFHFWENPGRGTPSLESEW